MSLLIIGLTAFAASMLTLFSGFGLGTILTPVFGLFFPINLAVALTGVVHLLNNLFKISLLHKNVSRPMLWAFGLPSVLGGFLGALCLGWLGDLPVLFAWEWGGKLREVSLLKLCLALLMVFFALMELLPSLKSLAFAPRYLRWGGLLSGFFGGLSGHQGALRSAFLVQSGLGKTQFIATGVAIACLVDCTRLPVYFAKFSAESVANEWLTLLVATLGAFAGAWIGTRFLQKVTLNAVKWLTATMIILIALLLGTGMV
jgi:hypothetical protein